MGENITFTCDVHVESLSEITSEQASRVLFGVLVNDDDSLRKIIKAFRHLISGSCTINYPLSTPFEFKISSIMSVGELLWEVSNKYKEVYNEPNNKYGIWGHGIGDLFIEGVVIKDGGIIELQMGS